MAQMTEEQRKQYEAVRARIADIELPVAQVRRNVVQYAKLGAVIADQILSDPAIAVLDGNQEMPRFSFSEEPPNMQFGWQEALKAVADFRRIIPKEAI